MYDRVLFPTDGSDVAELATDHAIAVAERFDAPLHAFYVVDTTIDATDAYDSSVAVEELAAAGEVQIEDVRDRAEDAGIAVTTAVEEGQPVETIVAQSRPGDVLVLGTHGRTGIDRFLVGSTTEDVIRSADVPVLAVPASNGDAEAE